MTARPRANTFAGAWDMPPEPSSKPLQSLLVPPLLVLPPADKQRHSVSCVLPLPAASASAARSRAATVDFGGSLDQSDECPLSPVLKECLTSLVDLTNSTSSSRTRPGG